jgi:hypothetical protein
VAHVVEDFMNEREAMGIDLERSLASLSPEARERVERVLREALWKEGALADAGFDRAGFDRAGFDRSTVEQQELRTKDEGPSR